MTNEGIFHLLLSHTSATICRPIFFQLFAYTMIIQLYYTCCKRSVILNFIIFVLMQEIQVSINVHHHDKMHKCRVV
jgi:hypothetical protein